MPWMHTAASGKNKGELVPCKAKEKCTLDGKDWTQAELNQHYANLAAQMNSDVFSVISVAKADKADSTKEVQLDEQKIDEHTLTEAPRFGSMTVWGHEAEMDYKDYTEGCCSNLAIGFHERMGWPVVAVMSDYDHEHGDWTHMGAQLPDGRIIDIQGIWQPEAWLNRWDRNAKIEELAPAGKSSPEELKKLQESYVGFTIDAEYGIKYDWDLAPNLQQSEMSTGQMVNSILKQITVSGNTNNNSSTKTVKKSVKEDVKEVQIPKESLDITEDELAKIRPLDGPARERIARESTDPRKLAALYQVSNGYVYSLTQNIAQNPNTPLETLEKILEDAIPHGGNSAMMTVLQHPNCSKELFDHAVNHREKTVRRAVADLPNLDDDLALKLAKDKSEMVQFGIAMNKNVKALEYLALHSADQDVLQQVARNSSTPGKSLSKIYDRLKAEMPKEVKTAQDKKFSVYLNRLKKTILENPNCPMKVMLDDANSSSEDE